MKRISGGIDVGSERHHVIIMNDKEEILYDREVAQKFKAPFFSWHKDHIRYRIPAFRKFRAC